VISVPQTEIAGSRRTLIIEEEEEEKEAEKEEEGQEEGETQDESSHADVYDGQYRDYDWFETHYWNLEDIDHVFYPSFCPKKCQDCQCPYWKTEWLTEKEDFENHPKFGLINWKNVLLECTDETCQEKRNPEVDPMFALDRCRSCCCHFCGKRKLCYQYCCNQD